MGYINIFASLRQLAGEKVILRPLAMSMAEELFAAVDESRDELMRFLPWENKTVEDTREFIERSVREREEGKSLGLGLYESSSDTYAGTIGLHFKDPYSPIGYIGYWIRTSLAGNGYATDAVTTLVRFCRDELKLVRIDAAVASTNIASQRVMAKCGFQEEGFKRKGQLCHGTWHDLKLFGKILT